MSNKLRRKRVLKPDGYEERFLIQKSRKNEKLSEDCFVEVFYSLQYISLTTLWMEKEDGGFDFTADELKRFNEGLIAHNESYDYEGGMSMAMENVHNMQIGFDCLAQAKRFPFRAKMKMYGKPLKTKKDYEIAINSTTEAIEAYLVLALHTLREEFRFSGEMIMAWWNKCIEVADLYVMGMKDEFIIDYLEKETGLELEVVKE